MNYQLLDFPIHGDHNGNLIALEKGKDFPFEIKRCFYVWGNSSDIVRGKHAHRYVKQVIICTSGSCDFILDDGTVREKIHLSSPTQGLYIPVGVWNEFTNFSDDCVVMVLASDYYDEKDYIRNYDEFLKEIK